MWIIIIIIIIIIIEGKKLMFPYIKISQKVSSFTLYVSNLNIRCSL
jgi:hypothetical protein